MSKKINLQLVMSVLSLIQNKEKWNINKLVQKLNISEKDLFYILSVITDIYSQQGELLIDYEYDDKNQELLSVSYTHLRAHETSYDLVCRLLL